jgi:hypothetical protein
MLCTGSTTRQAEVMAPPTVYFGSLYGEVRWFSDGEGRPFSPCRGSAIIVPNPLSCGRGGVNREINQISVRIVLQPEHVSHPSRILLGPLGKPYHAGSSASSNRVDGTSETHSPASLPVPACRECLASSARKPCTFSSAEPTVHFASTDSTDTADLTISGARSAFLQRALQD